VLWFWIFVGPALILAALSLRGERTRAAYVAERMSALDDPAPQPLPRVTVIVPLNHPTPALAGMLRSLAAQDYPDFELLVVAPGADSLPPGVALPSMVKVALSAARGRIPLLLAGVRASRRRSEVFAFAASSGQVSTLWLRALVTPLSDPGVGASTGFRWYTPEPPAFWPLMRSVWNGVIAGRLGPGANDFAWGGAMAISKEAFFQARLHEGWTGAERDDLALARAMHDSKRRIAFAPGALSACGGTSTARQFLAQARREMDLARRHFPRAWRYGLLAHMIYCGAMLAAAVASVRGSRGAEWALVVQFGLGMLKGANRATLARAGLPQCQAWFDRHSWTHTFWVPLATWVWLYVLISSAFGRNSGSKK
jgi:cellulose synthase/poly-beta-1,6-N-acetylglucosamine synthase-like glycosyltransferase